MLNKNNLGLAALATTDESRYAIGGILVAPDRTAATDGHMCAVISTPNLPADSVPLIPGFAPTVDFQPFILPRADAIEIGKAIPRKSMIPILSNAFVDAGVNGNARIAVTNLDSSRVFEVKKTAGQFPNVDMVIPKVDEAEISIALNPGYLCTLLKTLAPVSDEKQPVFILRIKDPETQIRVDVANTETGQTGIGVLMPVKAEGTHGVKPRMLTVEVESGRVRNIWTDDSLQVQVVRRNGVEIKGAELWGKPDLSRTREIPADILEYLAALTNPPEAPAPAPADEQPPSVVGGAPEPEPEPPAAEGSRAPVPLVSVRCPDCDQLAELVPGVVEPICAKCGQIFEAVQAAEPPAEPEAVPPAPVPEVAPEPPAGHAEPVPLAGVRAFWARKRAEAARQRLAQLDAAIGERETPEVATEVATPAVSSNGSTSGEPREASSPVPAAAQAPAPEPPAGDPEPPRQGATRYWVEVEGTKLAADYEADYLGWSHHHVEFRTIGPNPISETGYRSHFFNSPIEGDIQAGLQKIAEGILEEKRPKPRKPSAKRAASPAPAAPLASPSALAAPVFPIAAAPNRKAANGWDNPEIRAKRIAAIRAARERVAR